MASRKSFVDWQFCCTDLLDPAHCKLTISELWHGSPWLHWHLCKCFHLCLYESVLENQMDQQSHGSCQDCGLIHDWKSGIFWINILFNVKNIEFFKYIVGSCHDPFVSPEGSWGSLIYTLLDKRGIYDHSPWPPSNN